MTYHDNPTPPPVRRSNSYGILAVLGVLGLLILGAIALSMRGDNDNVANDNRPAATTTTGSGTTPPLPKRETTGAPVPSQQRPAPLAPAPKQ
jgi:hypothetical protein